MTDATFAAVEQPVEYLAILRRRKGLAAAALAFVAIVAVAVALFWPPVYRSTATILIEEPEIPDELVKSTISTFADERLQVIQQRVMTTQNLIDIINKFNLYPSERQDWPMSVVVDKMRNVIKLDMVSTDVNDPKSG